MSAVVQQWKTVNQHEPRQRNHILTDIQLTTLRYLSRKVCDLGDSNLRYRVGAQRWHKTNPLDLN